MSFFKKKLGFRWSLYITVNDNQVIYAMHENAVINLVGHVMRRFSNGNKPTEPWSLYLNFNHTNQNIKLGPQHFSQDGERITPLLSQQIKSIDPGYQVPVGDPVFVELATGKILKVLDDDTSDLINIKTTQDMTKYLEQRMANINKPKELTFFDILDQVFQR